MSRLDKADRRQLFSILKQRNEVDTTKTILIHYRDTLPSLDSFPKRDTVVYLDNGGHQHLGSHKTFVKSHNQCVRIETGKTISVYHFFNYNKGHPLQIGELKWQKDHLTLLRKLFYNFSDMHWALLIHPNGDFVINNRLISTKVWRQLKKHKKWENHLRDFKKAFVELNSYTTQ